MTTLLLAAAATTVQPPPGAGQVPVARAVATASVVIVSAARASDEPSPQRLQRQISRQGDVILVEFN